MTATFIGGDEFEILRDDSCQPRPTEIGGKHPSVEAAFSESQYQFKSPIAKKLTKLVKRKQQARVTVVGVFTDPGYYFGHQGCCRYRVEIQNLLAVDEVPKDGVTKPSP